MTIKLTIILLAVLSASACRSSDKRSDDIVNLTSVEDKQTKKLENLSPAVIENSISVLEKKSQGDKVAGEIFFDLGILYMIKGEFASAQKSIAQGIGLTKNRIEGTRLLAEMFLRQNKVKKAEFILNKEGGTTVQNSDFQNTLGNVMFAMKQFPEANAAWARSLKINADNSAATVNQQLMVLKSGQAINEDAPRISVDENFPQNDLAMIRGLVKLRQKQAEDALENFTTVWERGPSPEILQNLAVAQFLTGKLDEALASLDSVLLDKNADPAIKTQATRLKDKIEKQKKKMAQPPVQTASVPGEEPTAIAKQ